MSSKLGANQTGASFEIADGCAKSSSQVYDLILVSTSPRRRQILTEAGWPFRVDPLKVSEEIDESLDPRHMTEQLALRKAQNWVNLKGSMLPKPILLLTADTLVTIDGKVLGQPQNRDQGRKHLERLSGRTHQVVTGVCLWPLGPQAEYKFILFSEVALVTFQGLSDDEIDSYVDSGEGMDKAGGYGIQGLGSQFIKHLEGDYHNVMGLPLKRIEEVMHLQGWSLEGLKSKATHL